MSLSHKFVIFIVLWLSGPSISAPPQADPGSNPLVSILRQHVPPGEPVDLQAAPVWVQQMIQRIVRDNVPDRYVHDKDWGKTDRRWNGLKVRRDGLRLATKRKWKDVNHGTWKRYEISPVDPQENLTLRIDKIRDTGQGQVACEVQLACKLRLYGRMSQWAKGVRLYSVSADAVADVQLNVACQFGVQLDPQKFPPDVLLVPRVTDANLSVTDFQLQRVSKLDGPLVQQLSSRVRRLLLEKVEEKRDRLPEKINRQIAKNQSRMRFSIADLASQRWKTFTSNVHVEMEGWQHQGTESTE